MAQKGTDFWSINRLETISEWQARPLYVIPVGIIFVFVAPVVCWVIVAFAAAATIVVDMYVPMAHDSSTHIRFGEGGGIFVPCAHLLSLLQSLSNHRYFNIGATAVFLKPCVQALNRTSVRNAPTSPQLRPQNHSVAIKDLKKTKNLTLAGAVVIVVSSTLLYLNVVLWVIVRGPFVASPWLNPLVFGGNANSIMNDIGMMFVSGIAKKASTTSARRSSLGLRASTSGVSTVVDDNDDSRYESRR
jgi:hypothetical protein